MKLTPTNNLVEARQVKRLRKWSGDYGRRTVRGSYTSTTSNWRNALLGQPMRLLEAWHSICGSDLQLSKPGHIRSHEYLEFPDGFSNKFRASFFERVGATHNDERRAPGFRSRAQRAAAAGGGKGKSGESHRNN